MSNRVASFVILVVAPIRTIVKKRLSPKNKETKMEGEKKEGRKKIRGEKKGK